MSTTITRKDLTPFALYRERREEYLHKMISYKKHRRIKVAEHISLLFENRATVLFQIHELINSEDLTDTQEIDEYLEIYAGMLPAKQEWSGTMFIEMDNQKLLEELLVKLKGVEHYLSLVVENETIPATFEEVHDDREFTTSVHYLKFRLTDSAIDHLLNTDASSLDVRVELNHPNLSAAVKLSPDHVESLKHDLM